MSLNQILYFKETKVGANVYYEEEVKSINNIKGEVKKLALKYLFSLEGYLFAVKKQMLMKYKIPIYFSTRLFLFYVKTNDSLFLINLFAVFKILYNGNVVILFNNGVMLEIAVKKENIIKQLEKAKLILNYINNLL